MWSAAALIGLLVAGAAASPAAISNKDHTGRVVRKRTTETVQLYAYGTNISGLPIYVGTESKWPSPCPSSPSPALLFGIIALLPLTTRPRLLGHRRRRCQLDRRHLDY
jgi:hypothetical protein